MRELLVEVLTSLAENHPYLFAACAFIGAFWLARSFIHKARLFTEHLLKEVRGVKSELRDWLDVLRELGRELILRKTDDAPPNDAHSGRQRGSDREAA